MNKIVALAAILLIGPVIGAPAALAQTTTAPNSGAGVPGFPGNKSGLAVSPGTQLNVRPDQSNASGLPGGKSGPAVQPLAGLQDRAQSNEDEDQDQDVFNQRPGMMGMMEPGHHGGHRGHSLVGLRIIFSLMDADGDGKLTLQERQAAHERIFKAMDTDHDGTVTFEEMRAFIQGH
jgi:hypothetical protein